MKAAIFDRDGVLSYFAVDSAVAYIREALPLSLEELVAHWQRWGQQVGFPTSGDEESTFFAGLWQDLADKHSLSTRQRDHLCRFSYTDYMRVYPEAHAVLTALKQRGLKIGVLSNFSLATLDRSLEALGLADYVDEACAATVIGFAKPQPEAYRHVAARLQVPPNQCYYFDDEPDCVAGAAHCGMDAWLVDRTGRSDHPTLRSIRTLEFVPPLL